jgi:anti-anti-sigma factor
MASMITTFDCGGARIRAHCRHLATVVTIQGEIGADNVERIAQYLRRFLLGNGPMVLDASAVGRCSAAGLSLLLTFDDECCAAGLEWTLVPGRAVRDMLSAADAGETFPVAASVHEALHTLADAIVRRRQLVLPLVKKSA